MGGKRINSEKKSHCHSGDFCEVAFVSAWVGTLQLRCPERGGKLAQEPLVLLHGLWEPGTGAHVHTGRNRAQPSMFMQERW